VSAESMVVSIAVMRNRSRQKQVWKKLTYFSPPPMIYM